jgi:nucleoside 2-deoxyribosyltransferase
VIQPFDKGPYDKRYDDILEPAISEAGLEPYRVDQDPSVTIPIDDIENHIREAEICLADISTNNPNVWYEVGYAFANGKPVVLICAEPRTEAFPFDVRHRQIITYATQSSSDFEKLKKDVMAKLKAQLKKTEKLQTAVAMSQIKTTEGLRANEIAALYSIASEVSMPSDGLFPGRVKDLMKRSGFTPLASTLALAGLKQKEMLVFEMFHDNEIQESYPVCKLTDKALTWMLDNQDEFRMRNDEVDEQPEPQGRPTSIKDEDIPF